MFLLCSYIIRQQLSEWAETKAYKAIARRGFAYDEELQQSEVFSSHKNPSLSEAHHSAGVFDQIIAEKTLRTLIFLNKHLPCEQTHSYG